MQVARLAEEQAEAAAAEAVVDAAADSSPAKLVCCFLLHFILQCIHLLETRTQPKVLQCDAAMPQECHKNVHHTSCVL